MDERANLLFYWFFNGRNSFKSRLPHPKQKPLGRCLGVFVLPRNGSASSRLPHKDIISRFILIKI